MFTDLDQLISSFSELLSQISPLKGFLFVVFFFAVWFLPAIVAFFLNRKHFRKILAANVPAGLSWIAWVALLAWAVTGKLRDKDGAKGQITSGGNKEAGVSGKHAASSGR
ncbi:superinfection immunity protein [Microbulbifer variabilis]|uniref:Superinfection immunity protein n=1 Tax=Microbulbifer variabilis TaxID=266805 RepID=A0ABY4VAP3_9GAMM|nr:superinfection immunity protein [Microbulbifer variabilis]USD21346.1 superinfection immunity protein [Microbulbifer variabilis]